MASQETSSRIPSGSSTRSVQASVLKNGHPNAPFPVGSGKLWHQQGNGANNGSSKRHRNSSASSAKSNVNTSSSWNSSWTAETSDTTADSFSQYSHRQVPSHLAVGKSGGRGANAQRHLEAKDFNNTRGSHAKNYEISRNATIDSELASDLRAVAIEDEPTSFSTYQPGLRAMNPFGIPHQANRSVSIPQSRTLYTAYQQPDYNYYNMDYNYYANHSAPTHAHTPSVGRIYPGHTPSHSADYGTYTYDYGARATAPSGQYYYSVFTGPVASPLSPIAPAALPATALVDKKHSGMQYGMLQQQPTMSPQNVVYPTLRSSPSSQYTASEYGAQPMPMMVATNGMGLYGQPNPPTTKQTANLSSYNRPRRDNASGQTSSRSPLLDDFRQNKSRKWELRDIFGHAVEFSGDQHGSRFIQQKLENANVEEKQLLFDEIVPSHTLQLIKDVFGNYVIQKMLEHGTVGQRRLIAESMEGQIFELSTQMYGCRVVQKAIECISPEQQSVFVHELTPHVLKCVRDANGNHVVQKLIERVSVERLGFVASFKGNVFDLAAHPYGCRVLQRCFEHMPDAQTRPLLDELHEHAEALMQDQFGNYVIQFVLERGSHTDRFSIIDKVRGQLIVLARHKFASNVCEKALVAADTETRAAFIDEILSTLPDGSNPIVMMMKDAYANYVLQRALIVAKGTPERAQLVAKVRPALASLKKYSSAYSKHLVAIEKLLDEDEA